MFEVRTLREASPRVERPMLQIPDWHTSAGKNIYDRQAAVERQCRHIADTFREILFKYDDVSSIRLVVFLAGQGWLPLDAETLMGWLGRFYRLDNFFEAEQGQRLYQFLVSPESSLKFAQ